MPPRNVQATPSLTHPPLLLLFSRSLFLSLAIPQMVVDEDAWQCDEMLLFRKVDTAVVFSPVATDGWRHVEVHSNVVRDDDGSSKLKEKHTDMRIAEDDCAEWEAFLRAKGWAVRDN